MDKNPRRCVCPSRYVQVSRPLTGSLKVARLASAFKKNGMGRGLHAGQFVWEGTGVTIKGTLNGITNAGTHRAPAFKECQVCKEVGVMEGTLCGTVVKAEDPKLKKAGLPLPIAFALTLPNPAVRVRWWEPWKGSSCVRAPPEVSVCPQFSAANWCGPVAGETRRPFGTPKPRAFSCTKLMLVFPLDRKLVPDRPPISLSTSRLFRPQPIEFARVVWLRVCPRCRVNRFAPSITAGHLSELAGLDLASLSHRIPSD